MTDATRCPVRRLPLLGDGKQVVAPDGVYERPLRAMTMQNERVALAAYEIVRAPFTLEFFITVVGLGTTENGKITQDVLTAWFNYGKYTGLCQYRRGGHGRFETIIEVVQWSTQIVTVHVGVEAYFQTLARSRGRSVCSSLPKEGT